MTLLPTQYLPIGCVSDEIGLRTAIRNAPNYSSTPTNIELCAKYTAINVNTSSEINLKNKFVNFQCILPDVRDKCIIDAQQLSRHFIIIDSTISFNRIVFANGNVMRERINDGASLYVEKSTLVLNHCDFFGGVGSSGGAIFLIFSSITLQDVNFKNNTGGAVSTTNSRVQMTNVSLYNNSNDVSFVITYDLPLAFMYDVRYILTIHVCFPFTYHVWCTLAGRGDCFIQKCYYNDKC
jgi:hypothetical protein